MSDVDIHIRCMRCGTEMEMRDPGPGRPWTPDQFWVCPKCGRHFWTTYPPPTRDKPKPAAPEPVILTRREDRAKTAHSLDFAHRTCLDWRDFQLNRAGDRVQPAPRVRVRWPGRS